MSALGHIILGWLVGMMTGYLLNPMAGFFVAVIVGFFIGVATAVAALFLGAPNVHFRNHR